LPKGKAFGTEERSHHPRPSSGARALRMWQDSGDDGRRAKSGAMTKDQTRPGPYWISSDRCASGWRVDCWIGTVASAPPGFRCLASASESTAEDCCFDSFKPAKANSPLSLHEMRFSDPTGARIPVFKCAGFNHCRSGPRRLPLAAAFEVSAAI